MNQETLENIAVDIWNEVCKNIEQILKECDLFGLAGILTIDDPSLQDRIEILKKLDDLFELIIDNFDRSSVEHYSVTRIMFNAKQQILNLEMLLTAAKNNDEVGFNEIKNRLESQAKH